MPDAGRQPERIFHASNGIRLRVPGGWVVSDDAPKVQADLSLIVSARAEARQAGEDLSFAAQHATSSAIAPEPVGFHFLSLSDAIANIRPPEWLVHGVLERDSLAMFFGDPGAGKSFVAVDVAACVATGKKWHGQKVAPGPVLFIAGEGRGGIARRFKAWSISHGCSIERAPLYLSSSAVALTDWPSVAEVLRAAREVAADCGKPPVLILVDTVARNYGPGDENSTADMTAFIRGCDDLRQEFGACVLLIHHTGHGDKGRARGAMALKGALDFEYRLDRDELGVIRLESTKVKDHEAPAPLAFKLATVELGIADSDGRPVTSAVLRPVSFEPAAKPGQTGRGKHQTLALRVLRDLLASHRSRLVASGHDPGTARVSVQEWRLACITEGVDRRRVAEVVSSLADAGRVSVESGFAEPLEAP